MGKHALNGAVTHNAFPFGGPLSLICWFESSLYAPSLSAEQVENRQPYDTNPLYAIMHESIYISGDGVEGPSGWSAERVLAEDAEVRV